MEKNILRKELLKKRNELSQKYLSLKSKLAVKMIENHEKFLEANTVAIYYAFGSELDLSSLLKHQKTFLLPRIQDQNMIFVEVSKDTQFVKCKFGVLEPLGLAFSGTIDFMIVPMLGINKENYRIGYGKGYYDRYLLNQRPRFCLSIALDFQEITFQPSLFDQVVDAYIKI